MSKTDICIVGAGPAGLAASLTLGQAGVKTLLIDKAEFPRGKVCGDAISGKAVEVLNNISPDIIQRFAKFPQQLGSWGVTFYAPNTKQLRLPFPQSGAYENPPGFICKRLYFDNFLLEEVAKLPSVEIRQGLDIVHFEKSNDSYLLHTDGDDTIEAKLVIIANGSQSAFQKQKIIKKHFCAGIRAYYSGVEGLDEENFIELHFLKSVLPGYFWIFPLPEGGANIGIGMRSDIVSKRKVNLKKLLEEIITNEPTISSRFKSAKRMGDVKGHGLPLGSIKRKISGDGYMLTGDAASLIDPFTGEGIGNAMMSGWIAAKQAILASDANDYSASKLKSYDHEVFKRLGAELGISYKLQKLARYPVLFNFVVNKANHRQKTKDLISRMFVDVELRGKLKNPLFFTKMFFGL